MNWIAFPVRRGAFTLVVTLGLMLVGGFAYLRIPRAEDPSLKVPALDVIVVAPGLGAADLEERVARPLEDAIKELDDLDKLQATIRDGLVVVMAEFRYGTDPERKEDDVLRQVNATRPRLPAGIRRIEVRRFQTLDVALLQYALVSPVAGYGLLQDVAEDLRRRLEAVPGVRRVEKWAYPAREMRVDVDPERLAQLGIPVDVLVGALLDANLLLPAGAAEAGLRRFTVTPVGALASAKQIREIPLRATGEGMVTVGDVAAVDWDLAEAGHIGRFNGERAVFVTVLPQEGENVFAVRDAVRSAAAEFAGGLPGRVRLEVGFDQSENVRTRLGRLEADFLLAFTLVLVTLLPLGFRAGLLVLVSIPLSLAVGVALLLAAGFTLNQLSIVGFVIALGLLVDDSIVVVENISRLRRSGLGPVDAAIAGTRQVAAPVVGTTVALLFAFLPLLMLPGGAGQFIRGLPMAVVFTVLASMVVSLGIMPFLASRWLTGSEDPEGNRLLRRVNGVIHAVYRPLLNACMGRPRRTLVAALAVCAATLLLLPRIGFSLFPKAGVPQFLIRVHGAEGNSVAATDLLVRRVEEILAGEPAVAWWYANVGRGNPQVYYNEVPEQSSARTGEVFASLRTWDPRESPAVLSRLRNRLADIPGARVVLREFQNGPPVEAPVAVRVIGPDLDVLAGLAREVEAILVGTPGTEAVDNPVRRPRTDLRIELDRMRAAALGVSDLAVDRAARLALAGLEVGRFREPGGEEYDLVVGLPRGERAGLDHWDRLWVPGRGGAAVPLGEVAGLRMESVPALVQRFNRERTVTLTAEVVPGTNTDRVTREVAARLAGMRFPRGYRHEFGGEVESREESFAGLGGAVLVALAGILAVLVLEFGSFRGAAIVASVVPLGTVGGLLGLWIAGESLSFTAAIGFIALTGIEIKNSLLFVDFTQQLRARGVPLAAAIEQAGEARFLPVVLTTVTALGALVPLVLAKSAMYSPLAIVILGGLLSSLLLSRVVTPVLLLLWPPPAPEASPQPDAGC